MKTWLLVILSVLVLSVLSVALILPLYAKSKIQREVSEACPQCKLELSWISINPFTLTVTVRGVDFESDPHDVTPLRVRAPLLKIDFEGKDRIKNLVFDGLEVWVTESKQPEAKPDEKELAEIERSYGGKVFEVLPPFLIERIHLRDTVFHYTFKIFGKEARLNVSEIEAHIGKLATRKEWASKETPVSLVGKVQQSGKLNLEIQADLFSIKNSDKINLLVEDLPMSEMNSFFFVEDGIKMQGLLKKAEAEMLLARGHLTGKMKVAYNDFKMDFHPTPNQGKFAAWIANWISKVKIAPTKPSNKLPPPVAEIDYKRKPNQSFINVILQGMKEAALKAASH